MPVTQTNLRSEAVQDILTAVPNWMIRWGNTLMMVLLVLFLILSCVIKYPDSIEATALVTTEIPPQQEYAKVSGKLKHILVSNAEMVKESQDLAVIENTANYQDIVHLKSIIDTLTFTKEYFYFPINEIPLLFLGEVDDNYAAFENNYIAYDLNRRLQPFDGKKLSQQLSQKEIRSRLSNLIAQRSIKEKEIGFQASNFKRHKELYEKGVISLQEFEQKEMAYLQADRNFKALSISISQLRENLSTTASTFEVEKTNQSGEDMRLLRATIQSFNQLKKAIYDWEATYVLRSEINGTVSFLDFWSINQQVRPDDLIFTIIPQKNTRHIAKLKIPTFNSGKLAIGQKVYLMLDKYPEKEYGKLKSEINKISAVADEEGNYLVDVILDRELVSTYDKKIPFQSEMSGRATVITEDLRLLERFFYQIRGIFQS